jgi:hypothetical protein
MQTVIAIGTHLVGLLLYPGLTAMLAFGMLAEATWMRLTNRGSPWPTIPRRRPGAVEVTVALGAILASAQLAAPFSPVPGEERSVVLAAVGLAFATWAELALTVEYVAEPGLLLLIQVCWLLAVLGPAVQPESLRPQVLGNVLVPGLLPVKIASAFLYLLCLPALLRLWPLAPPGDRRGRPRIDAARVLCWFPCCGLFTTLFITPGTDDAVSVVRFFALTFAVAAIVIAAGWLVHIRGPKIARAFYARGVAPYAAVVLGVVIVTSVLMR